MAKVTDSQLIQAQQKHGTDFDAIATELCVHKSTVYYRLQQLKNKTAQATTQTEIKAVEEIPVQQFNAVITKTEDVVKLNSDINVSALIPEIDVQYKRRSIDDAVEKYFKRSSTPVILIGEAGCGKTYLANQLSARQRLPFLRVACDDSAVLKELIGRREIRNGTTYFKNGLLTEAMQIPSIILIDEFNCLPSSRLFFLHELLDNRRIFIKETDEIITAHKDCKILLACNPNSVRYSGTNKMNVALADRGRILEVPHFTIAEADMYFDCNDIKLTNSLKKFFTECTRVIHEQNLRIVFSLRAVKRIAEALKNKDSIQDAIAHNFYNMALLTASEKERDTIRELARICFGVDSL